MIFSSHYIEESLYYKEYEKVVELLRDREAETVDHDEEEINIRLMSRKERKKHYAVKDLIFFRESLKLLAPMLKGADIAIEENNFILPYKIEGKQAAFSVISHVLTFIENGEKKEYPLIKRKYSVFMKMNILFILSQVLWGKN